jgi:hypothetical protein
MSTSVKEDWKERKKYDHLVGQNVTVEAAVYFMNNFCTVNLKNT